MCRIMTEISETAETYKTWGTLRLGVRYEHLFDVTDLVRNIGLKQDLMADQMEAVVRELATRELDGKMVVYRDIQRRLQNEMAEGNENQIKLWQSMLTDYHLRVLESEVVLSD